MLCVLSIIISKEYTIKLQESKIFSYFVELLQIETNLTINKLYQFNLNN